MKLLLLQISIPLLENAEQLVRILSFRARQRPSAAVCQIKNEPLGGSRYGANYCSCMPAPFQCLALVCPTCVGERTPLKCALFVCWLIHRRAADG